MQSAYEESILTALRRISRAIDLFSRSLAKQSGLTVPQLVCLKHLACSGPTAPTVLARSVVLSSATVTGILDRLVRRGLVSRRRLEQDRRRVEVELTEAGRRVTADAPFPLQTRFAQRLIELPPEEQHEIDTVLQRITEMMEADDIDAAPMLATGPALVEPARVAEFLDGEAAPGKPPSPGPKSA